MTHRGRARRSRARHETNPGALAATLEKGRQQARQQLSLQALLAGKGQPSNLLALQRVAGNRAAGLVASGGQAVGLPSSLRRAAELASGIGLGDVGVHYGSARPSQLAAEAVSHGGEIHLGPGHDDHLPHELWHVVQQRQGRVASQASLNGLGVNADRSLEHEAETVGRSFPTSGSASRRQPTAAASGGVAQFAGWQIDRLFREITRQGLSGVCNAMSTAWLLNLIRPAGDSPVGIGADNWASIRALKSILDNISEVTKADSERASLAFVQYFREEGLDGTWFSGLGPDSVAGEVEKFRQFTMKKGRKGEAAPQFEDDEDEERQEAEQDHLEKGMDVLGDGTESGDDDNEYADWTVPKIEEVVDEALEDSFTLDGTIEGIVSIKAKRQSDRHPQPGDYANHQFAIQYEGRQLTILDQNKGATAHAAITSDDMFSAAIANYIRDNYIANPMAALNGATHEAKIVVNLRSKDAPEPEGDVDEGVVAEGGVDEGAE